MASLKAPHHRQTAIDIGDLFRKMLFHWPLYLIAILLAGAAGWAYLRYTPPSYMSSARLYLKDEKKSNGEEADVLKSLSLLGSGKNMENEMELLHSPILLQRVISSNHFNVRYFAPHHLRDKEWYPKSPIVIQILSDSCHTGNYTFEVSRVQQHFDVKARAGKDKRSTHFTITPNTPFSIGKDTFSLQAGPLPFSESTPCRIEVDSAIELAYKSVDDITTALVNRDATVIAITYKDPLARRSADFLNALLDEYNDYTLSDKNKAGVKTIQFLNGRIDSLKEELGLLERTEELFKVQRGITDIDASSKLALEQVKDADIKLNEANLQLAVMDQVEEYINTPDNRTPFTPVTGNVDPALSGMINRYEEALREQRKLSLAVQPSSFLMQNLDTQVNAARGTIRDYISGYRRNANVAQHATQQKVNTIEGKIANIPSYSREYVNIKRQQSVKENLYLYLLKKKEEAAVTKASNVIDNKVIAPAFVPEDPVTPKKPMVFVSFMVLAAIAVSIYVYVKYFLNPRILARNEIEQVFNLPVIAEIFQYTEGVHDFSLKIHSILTEQIFNLRTNLRFLLADHKGPATVMLTSSISGEGKTFLSAHLANSLTVNNKKVVLLEMDLRKPKLSAFFGIDHKTGITNYLLGTKTMEEIIREVPDTNLWLVSAGPIPPNPIELIESPRMAYLLAELKNRFDYIIIDTSPVGIVSDAKSIASYVDCTLFAVRYNFTHKAKLLAVEESLKEPVFKKKGLIFNGIVQDSFYPYYYYGRYSYNQGGKNHKSNWTTIFKKTGKRIA
ncbi:polysaccharide biosynthesis tyrosine autokinase [Chitinophaga sp. G-6-1-13]|uniref:non-specific protein-tyrosine kinase n=1 Tax=Chitinophaga fulva TaxID=2728842 RepID=A0A848GLN1_9BACT|nr:polysaccharide biosynthesis tyrosine autokinase [Chitinophaga fulva]NML38531.1 polysaccharide biosynthesis tyrosine autokinase [Chitinophaga fulva]